MSESMREEFEAWLDSAGFEVRRYHHIDGYHGSEQMAAWAAWQASRAALCVELPPSLDMPDEDECGDYEEYEEMEAITCTANGMRHACRNAIHAAGVKTK